MIDGNSIFVEGVADLGDGIRLIRDADSPTGFVLALDRSERALTADEVYNLGLALARLAAAK